MSPVYYPVMSSPPLRRAALAALAFPAILLSQSSARLDEGTFTITRKGVPVGREQFRIDRAPEQGGQIYKATGTTVVDDRRVDTRLGTDSSGAPVSYLAQVLENRLTVSALEGRGRTGRFSVVSRTRGGESAREYMLVNGALLMDENVFHHFYFVVKATGHERVNVLVPGVAQQSQFRLEAGASETVEIAGKRLPGRKYSLVSEDGLARHVWVDSLGRVLKVSIPEKQLVALRDDPPR